MPGENKHLLEAAKDALRGRWGLPIGAFLIYSIITSGAGISKMWGPVSLIIAGPMMLGAAYFSLDISRGKELKLERMFDGFKLFSKALVTYLLMLVYVLLYLLLLIVPGIIAALGYSMTFYILADNPELSPGEALNRSKTMMYGYKMRLFNLCLWFLLLAILCVLTLGIGFLWFIPYAHVTTAKFYDEIRQQYNYGATS